MRLMAHLGVGHGDVDRFLREHSAPQILEWLTYWKLEPFGPLQEGQYFGEMTATIINANPFRKRRGTLRARDIYPFLSEESRERPTAEQLRLKVEHLIAAFGGQIETKQG